MADCDHEWVAIGQMDTDNGKKTLSVCNKCGDQKIE